MLTPRQPVPRWPFVLLGFVGLSLLALLASPILLEWQDDQVEDSIRQLEPGRQYASQLELALVREALAERRYLMTGDTTHLLQIAQMRQQQEAALAGLRGLVPTLPSRADSALTRLEGLLAAWHDTRQTVLADVPAAQQAEAFRQLASMYESSLSAAQRIVAAVEQAASQRREEFRSRERTWRIASSSLALLTIVGVGLLAWVGWYLHRLSRRMQRAVAARDDVLKMVSHDLRNPLNSVSIACDTLLDVCDEDRQVHLIQLIDAAAGKMKVLAEDLLDAEMIARDELMLDEQIVDVSSILDEVMEATHLVASTKGLEVGANKPPESIAVRGDPDRLERVFLNLISNAMRATDRGGTITIGAVAEEAFVRFYVGDTGEGMPMGDMEVLSDRTMPRSNGGYGLGLAIVRGIVEAHGGEISVASQTGVGTVFSFTIPRVEDGSAA